MERTWWDNVKDFFFFMFRPWYWNMNHELDELWDAKISFLIANSNFRNIDQWHAEIGKYKVWISNHPYASFTQVGFMSSHRSGRPRRRTIHLAWKQLKRDCLAEVVTDKIRTP